MTPSYKSRPKSLGSHSGNSFSRTFNKVTKSVRSSPLLKLKVCFSREVNVVPPQAAATKVTVLYVAVHLNLRSVFTFASVYINFHCSSADKHDMRLQTRESRREWEADFSSVFIAPVLVVRFQYFLVVFLYMYYIYIPVFV